MYCLGNADPPKLFKAVFVKLKKNDCVGESKQKEPNFTNKKKPFSFPLAQNKENMSLSELGKELYRDDDQHDRLNKQGRIYC